MQKGERINQNEAQKAGEDFSIFVCPFCDTKNNVCSETCSKCHKINPLLRSQDFGEIINQNEQKAKLIVKQQQPKQIEQPKRDQQIKFVCPFCTFENFQYINYCEMCAQPNPAASSPKKQQGSNPNSQATLSIISQNDYNQLAMQEFMQQSSLMIEDNYTAECMHCKKQIAFDNLNAHEESCGKEQAILNQKKQLFKKKCWLSDENLKRLTTQQVKCIAQESEKAYQESNKIEEQFYSRLEALGFKQVSGYTNVEIEQLLFYIRSLAPLVIHVNLQANLNNFLKDTHYRNCFEVSAKDNSYLSQRIAWEARLFDNIYTKSSYFDKPKYGTLNFLNDKKGVSSAYNYGNSYFILKYEVRQRTTITDQDSFSNCKVGTLANCLQILQTLSDQELKGCILATNEGHEKSDIQACYKELQFHGPIEFSKDIEALYVNDSLKSDKQLIDNVSIFCKKNGFPFYFFTQK